MDGTLDMNITVESFVPVNSARWRTYAPPTAAEKAEYYKSYDPLTGIRIAATLSSFFLAAVLYILYKSKCKRVKVPSQQAGFAEPNDQESWPAPWDNIVNTELADEQSNILEAGQQSPVNSNIYYNDDSRMPPWKVYAKELFLYGGPGLWRSSSLLGSAPLPNVPVCTSEDYPLTNSRSSLGAMSLTGSVMARLGARGRPSNRSGGSRSTLRVPTDLDVDSKRNRILPMRSVSFREREESRNGKHFKRTASLRVDGLRKDRLTRTSVSSPASRQTSVSPCVSRQNSKRKQSPLTKRKLSMKSYSVQQDCKRLGKRSASFSDQKSSANWRSTLVKLIRTKSTCGYTGSQSTSGSDTSNKCSVQLQTTDSQTLPWQMGNYDGISDCINIRVIQATPAVSPCTSIKTLSGESLEIPSLPVISETDTIPVLLSVEDRRKRFANARMKGQTIDYSDKTTNNDDFSNNSSRIWLEVPTLYRETPGSPSRVSKLLRPTRSYDRSPVLSSRTNRRSSVHSPQV